MSEIAITHSSTACVLLEIGSLRILTDPVLDSGAADYRLGPAAWARRYVGPAIDVMAMPPPDVVLLSHAHHLDNLDHTGAHLLGEARTVITCAEDVGLLNRDDAVGLAPWEETTIVGSDGLQVHIMATPALHGPRFLKDPRHVIGFVLRWDGQQNGALYISGDTVFFPGIREIAERCHIGTALLHLGAVHFWPPWPPCFRYTCNGREAARTAKLLDAKTIIPIHYERSVWSHFRESVASYRREFRHAGLDHAVRWLNHGQRTMITV